MGPSPSRQIRRHQTSLAAALPADQFDDPPNAEVFFSTPFMLRAEGEQVGRGWLRRVAFRPAAEFDFLSATGDRTACTETVPSKQALMTCHRPGADRVNVRKQAVKTPIAMHDAVILYGNTAKGKYLQREPEHCGGRFAFNASPSRVRRDPGACCEFLLKPALRARASQKTPLRFGDLVAFRDRVTGMYLHVSSPSGHVTLSSKRRTLFSVQNPTLLQLVKIRDMAQAEALLSPPPPAAVALPYTELSSSSTTATAAAAAADSVSTLATSPPQHLPQVREESSDSEEDDVFRPLVEDPTNNALWEHMARLPIEVMVRVLSFRRNFLGTARLLSKSWKHAAELMVRSIRVNGDFGMFHIPEERVSLITLVARCANLEKLRLKNIIELQDEDVEAMNLHQHAQLRHVEMGGCRGLTDRTTKELALIPVLEYLNLAATDISDHSLCVIGDIPRIRVVNLYGCRVTSAGMQMCTQKTEGSPVTLALLDHMNLRGTVVSRDDVVPFKRRRPSVEVLTGPMKQETVFG